MTALIQSGPTLPSWYMIVGEAPGVEEARVGRPFVGASGRLLDQMLHEVGILRSEAFVTNVCHERPPGNEMSLWFAQAKKDRTADSVQHGGLWMDRRVVAGIEQLRADVAARHPTVIIALGNSALWALTGKFGIKKWAGSRLEYAGEITGNYPRPIVIPTYHPAAVLREYELRPMVVQDLRRAARAKPTDTPPEYNFLVRPTFDQVVSYLSALHRELDLAPKKLAVDIETRDGETACLGIATSKTDAICIPFLCVERAEGYWSEAEEFAIIRLLRSTLAHPNAQVVGQNFLYDVQYLHRYWRCIPTLVRDTMAAQHVLFAGMPKGLDYLSRMWCEWHVYWKDESKDWDPKVGEDQLWFYNCKDCVATFEVDTAQQRAVDQMQLRHTHDKHQAKFWQALDIMLRGMRRDPKLVAETAKTLIEELSSREAWLARVLGHEINPQSPKQLAQLFYIDFAQKPVINRKTGGPTCNEEALETIAKREPLLLPVCRRINEHRSLQVFYSTFVEARPSWDGRMRTQFNPFGPETYRASSSTDAFGSGANMQNIPSGKEENGLVLPNIRKFFIPDPGMTIFESDLDRADLQVVVWEADDAGLKSALRAGLDLHLYNARSIFGLPFSDSEIVEGSETCEEHKRRYRVQRQKAKAGCHATNYGVGDRTLAIAMGITVHEAGRFINTWLSAHPGIRTWHNRTQGQITTRRYVENRFGYRRYYLGRPDGVLPEALAWVPQSTVAEVINTLWKLILLKAQWIQPLLQVHDSLVFQAPTDTALNTKATVKSLAASVVVPYNDPLVIPVGIKSSTESWGAAK